MTTRVPAIEGWFSTGATPRLLGKRCTSCGTYAFPPDPTVCPNPACTSVALDDVELSNRGRVWSFTTNHYAPPAPYVSPDPFVPYTVVAVELETERMVVLGQLSEDADASALRVGAEVELTIEPLFTDDDGEHIVWRWRPL
jgi:uncharacterized OB-fold protein